MRAVISEIETRLDEPSARGLAAAVSRTIRDGALRPGDRLPPIRGLARELALSPTTVSAAWSVLARAGTIRTLGRRGTVVADSSGPRDGRYRQALEHPVAFPLDLSTGVPDERLLPGLGPALRAVTTAGTPRSYLDDPVLPELHEVLVASWPYEPPALTVCDGAMDAVELVLRARVRYGDRVLVEHPTFPPLLDLLEAAGAEVVGVPLDEEGLQPAALRAALAAAPAAALVWQPRAHNPTGVATSPRRLEELARLLRTCEAIVVEDDSASAISTAPDLTLGTVLPERTVHVRSFSKSHGPDLRLAAMSGPADLVADVRHLRQLGQGWSSRLLQRVLVHLLTDAGSIDQVAAARDEYDRRRTTFVARLAAAGVEVPGSDGLNVWVPVHDEAAALVRLASRGIGVAPGRPFTVLPERQGHVRVSVGLVRDELGRVADEVVAAARTTGWGARSR
ncbi:MAG TPA: aminotransferase class I/II-fold pyridoxal phosphate-dependent enzyme [Marmoricola sp.]|nr:aminotransferase class I/II-fold pyridoxal phosphate-dependent enzyme [Marmoricola sp.]